MTTRTIFESAAATLLSGAVMCASSAGARATVYTGSLNRTQITTVAATNVRRINVSVDNKTGTWTTFMTFRGSLRKTTLARTYLAFKLAKPTPSGNAQGGFIEVTTRGSKSTGVLRDQGLGDDSGPTPTTQIKRTSKTLTVTVVDSRLVGLIPAACYPTTISWHNRVQDRISDFPLAQRDAHGASRPGD